MCACLLVHTCTELQVKEHDLLSKVKKLENKLESWLNTKKAGQHAGQEKAPLKRRRFSLKRFSLRGDNQPTTAAPQAGATALSDDAGTSEGGNEGINQQANNEGALKDTTTSLEETKMKHSSEKLSEQGYVRWLRDETEKLLGQYEKGVQHVTDQMGKAKK